MKTARKALMLILCAALLVSATVMGTLAYLTAKTNTVTNTFTVGNVTIDEEDGLTEAKVNLYGKPVDANGKEVEEDKAPRVTKNTYKLIPGASYTKDPTVHITKGSEPCYLFVKVDNEISAIEAGTTIAAQMAKDGLWTPIAEGSNIYYYKNVVDAREAQQDIEVFKTFTLKNDANVAAYANKTITVQAYAIQKEGFDDAMAAWEAAPLTAWTPSAE